MDNDESDDELSEEDDDAGAEAEFADMKGDADSEDEGAIPKKRSSDKNFTTTGDYYKSIENLFDNAYRNRTDYESDEVISGSESEDEIVPEKYIDTDEENDSSSDDGDEDSDSIAQVCIQPSSRLFTTAGISPHHFEQSHSTVFTPLIAFSLF